MCMYDGVYKMNYKKHIIILLVALICIFVYPESTNLALKIGSIAGIIAFRVHAL